MVLLGMLRSPGIEIRSITIALSALALAATRRVPLPLIILGGALAGVLMYS
jgi:hypothetical protein